MSIDLGDLQLIRTKVKGRNVENKIQALPIRKSSAEYTVKMGSRVPGRKYKRYSVETCIFVAGVWGITFVRRAFGINTVIRRRAQRVDL